MKEKLIKIISDPHLLESFRRELGANETVEQAIWYTLRDGETDKALREDGFDKSAAWRG